MTEKEELITEIVERFSKTEGRVSVKDLLKLLVKLSTENKDMEDGLIQRIDGVPDNKTV